MNSKIKSIVANSISIFLIIFWLYVGFEKAWSWKNFQLSLHQQPIPTWSVDILYWLLPLAEIVTGILLAIWISKLKRLGYWGSILLLTTFTIFIGLGVVGVYEKRPCTCASIFNDMSWEWHLVVNILLLAISILGLNLIRPNLNNPTTHKPYRNSIALFLLYAVLTKMGTIQNQQLSWVDNVYVVPEKMQLYPSILVHCAIVVR
ncbi:MauE/DoxX family redox-associated membrane protein [Sphingobacterium sp. SG20118]|uniref:MauE/DoxX family redox-associated membrane protein n=1 Tax=Sphingobacterium sp. SG20118 TaxID=3367156 RepID=UPI0037DFC310